MLLTDQMRFDAFGENATPAALTGVALAFRLLALP
jgi:hypothetical protein